MTTKQERARAALDTLDKLEGDYSELELIDYECVEFIASHKEIIREALTDMAADVPFVKLPPVIERALRQYRDEYCFDDSEYGMAIDAFFADLKQTPPDGYVLVPINPDYEVYNAMADAVANMRDAEQMTDEMMVAYKAMLSFATQPKPETVGLEELRSIANKYVFEIDPPTHSRADYSIYLCSFMDHIAQNFNITRKVL